MLSWQKLENAYIEQRVTKLPKDKFVECKNFLLLLKISIIHREKEEIVNMPFVQLTIIKIGVNAPYWWLQYFHCDSNGDTSVLC